MKTLGQYIREERDRKDVSLREFAKKIDCSPAFLSDIELGRRNPSEDVFIKIAQSLNVSVADIKKYDTRPPTEDMRRHATSDPKMAFAFRTILENKISPDELIKFAENQRKKKGNESIQNKKRTS